MKRQIIFRQLLIHRPPPHRIDEALPAATFAGELGELPGRFHDLWPRLHQLLSHARALASFAWGVSQGQIEEMSHDLGFDEGIV